MNIGEFRKRRNEALSVLDIEWAREMIPTASSDDVLLSALHKARYDCKDIMPELRHESADWLRKNGMGRLNGMPLLPEYELPE